VVVGPKDITLESNRPILYHLAMDNLEDHLFYGDIDPLADKKWNAEINKLEATIRHFFAPGTTFNTCIKLSLDDLGRARKV